MTPMQNSLFPFRRRSNRPELMEQPGLDKRELIRALRELRWVNRRLGGSAIILEALQEVLRSQPAIGASEPVSILDLGTGSADIPLALADWGRAAGRPLRITAVDVHPTAVETARLLVRDYPEIHVAREDALHLPYPPECFDVVISSLFLHHLSPTEAVSVLKAMARLCRRGIIVNDLERHPLAWLGIWLLGALTGKGRVFRNDAPLSVLRGFTQSELQALSERAGMEGARLRHRRPYRWLLTWLKPQVGKWKPRP